MKRLIAAVSFAVAAAPVLAAEAPFEQTQFDRGQPNIQAQSQNASAGSSAATGVWAGDYNVVAPAQ
jgi:hypothetical protein